MLLIPGERLLTCCCLDLTSHPKWKVPITKKRLLEVLASLGIQ